MQEARPGHELRLEDFPIQTPYATRWADNDMYGHMNNAIYYQLFDSAVNGHIISGTGAGIADLSVQNVVAESGCKFFGEVAFPEPIIVGLGVERLGNSSVVYQLGLFGSEPESDPSIRALGRWVHVYIDATTRRPVPIPPRIRHLLEDLSATKISRRA